MCSVVSDSLQPYRLWPALLLCPWDLPGQNTGVGCCFLLGGGGDLSNLGIGPASPALASGFFTITLPGKPFIVMGGL